MIASRPLTGAQLDHLSRAEWTRAAAAIRASYPAGDPRAAWVDKYREHELPPDPAEDLSDLEAELIRVVAEVYAAQTRRGPVSERLRQAIEWIARMVELRQGFVPDPSAPENTFEAWLVKKWLRDIRSEAFRESAQNQFLIAEWERS